MSRRKVTLLSTTVVLLAVIGTAAVVAQRADEPPPSTESVELSPVPQVVDLSQIKEEAIRALFDDTGRMINPDQKLAQVAKDHEGGFGGYYFNRTDKSVVYVYMLDVTKTDAAEAAFRAAYALAYRDTIHRKVRSRACPRSGNCG